MTASAVTRTRRRARATLGRFLYVYGPSWAYLAALALAMLAFISIAALWVR